MTRSGVIFSTCYRQLLKSLPAKTADCWRIFASLDTFSVAQRTVSKLYTKYRINLDTFDILSSSLSALLFEDSVTLFVLTAAAASTINGLTLGTLPDTTQCRLPKINQHRL